MNIYSFRCGDILVNEMGMSELGQLAAYLPRFRDVRIVCVGDVMLDRFIYGEVERISPEAPIPVIRVLHETAMLGGAGNVVRNVAALGAHGARVADGQGFLRVSIGPLGLRARAAKRLFDLILAGGGLILLSPLLLLVAIAILLEDGSPVLFVQRRVGRGNRFFNMLKFRSMRSAASDGAGELSTRRDDDRITRVGRLIRRTSIDELPQLFNVLRGEMSMVGPRPHALGSQAGEKLFWEIDDRYWERHALKPGLTGLAQIRGHRGATEREEDLAQRLESDLEYLDGWLRLVIRR